LAIGLIVIVLAVVLPGAYLVWRFRREDEQPSEGGSFGDQISGNGKNDWGPTSP
jgi:heme/copper-type cytochrome/quinol oxidase subunit 2